MLLSTVSRPLDVPLTNFLPKQYMRKVFLWLDKLNIKSLFYDTEYFLFPVGWLIGLDILNKRIQKAEPWQQL